MRDEEADDIHDRPVAFHETMTTRALADINDSTRIEENKSDNEEHPEEIGIGPTLLLVSME